MIFTYFDESGFTGDNLLDADQPFFCYAGVTFQTETEASVLWKNILTKHSIHAAELKGASLVKRATHRDFLLNLIKNLKDRVGIIYHDKTFALAGKIFEYVFEPVLAVNSRAIYEMRFHRFIQYHLYNRFLTAHQTSEQIFTAFQSYVRGKSNDLFSLFPSVASVTTDSKTALILQFIAKHRAEIDKEIGPGEDTKWMLDLTTTSLHNLIAELAGSGSIPIIATCDMSKPIMAVMDLNSVFVNDKRILWSTIDGVRHRLNYNLSEPLRLRDSQTEPGLQLADVIASVVNYSLKNNEETFSKSVLDLIRENVVWRASVVPTGSLNEFPVKAKIIYKRFLERLVENSKNKDILSMIRKFRIEFFTNLSVNPSNNRLE